MVIGNNVTVSRDDHARARGPGRPARLLLASTGSVKKIKEVIERKLLSAAVTVVHWVSCLDVHNGRGNLGRCLCKIHQSRRSHHSRSEEHTSELQSLMRISYAVFCLKKKKIQTH